MKKFIKDVVEIFCYINTGAMLAAASFITVFNRDESFSYLIFWEIALVSLISAVLSALIYTKENDSKKKAKIKAINGAVNDDLTTYQKKALYRIFNVN